MVRKVSVSRRYNLDHLRYLQVLLEEHSVTKAARRLQVSDAAMSRHLATLRTVFGDPLLVLSGRRLVPTPFATNILSRVQNVVREADALVNDAIGLNLKALSPRFTIRAHDLIAGAFGHAILEGLQRDCPQCQVVFSPETGDSAGEALRKGAIDLYIGATDDLHPEIKKQTLFHTIFQGVVRAGHPILRAAITPETLVAYDHISISRKGRVWGPIDDILERDFSLKRRIALVVPSYYAMIDTMRETDMILPLPDIITRRLPLEEIDAVAFDFPMKLPPVISFQAWHPRLDHDLVHRWLRETVMTVVQSAARNLGRPTETRFSGTSATSLLHQNE